MGRYVPPEHEGTVSANKLAGKHALGNRARKLDKGILTVRFEMPFPIWCTTCQPHPLIIGQGVRFNAEKKKIGNYYTTPIYSFRIKHSVCGGWIEIHTDPKNTAYVVISGAKKRDTGEDKDVEGEIKTRTAEERERLENDPFAALDEKVEDRRQALSQKTRIEDLKKLRDRDWSDPYEGSRKLRKIFRAERNIRHKNAAATEDLKDRMGLGIELLEEAEEDRQRAKYIDFAPPDSDTLVTRAKTRPLFSTPPKSKEPRHDSDSKDIKPPLPISTTTTKPASRNPKPKRATEAAKSRDKLHRELRANTRAVLDPFLVGDGDWGGPGGGGGAGDSKRFVIPKRKEGDAGGFKEVEGLGGEGGSGGVMGGSTSEEVGEGEEGKETGGLALGLVDYDSD
ncbi:MAG: hypothetical protein M1839_004525 [Geoglossum umbratile]|nr:MAG: hypothetical protein M1839_004525 [Geoglossum umbratile]